MGKKAEKWEARYKEERLRVLELGSLLGKTLVKLGVLTKTESVSANDMVDAIVDWLGKPLPKASPAPLPTVPVPLKACEPCVGRRKIVLGIMGVRDDHSSGVSQAQLVDFLNFDIKTPGERPVLVIRFCPWCGGRVEPKNGLFITELSFGPKIDEGETKL